MPITSPSPVLSPFQVYKQQMADSTINAATELKWQFRGVQGDKDQHGELFGAGA